MNPETSNSILLSDPKLLAAFYRDKLLGETLGFWFPRSIDTQFGGYLHCLDADGTLVDSDKSVWAQGRMAWMLLTIHNSLNPDPQLVTWAQSGLEFLWKYGFDSDDGRMYFHLTREGSPIRKRRYAYSESFAAIACAAKYRATGESVWRERAVQMLDFFHDWNFTPGRMPAKFCGTRPTTGIGPRMIAITTAQSLRQDAGTDSKYQAWIDKLIDEIERLFVKHDHQAVLETVGEDGSILDHFDGRTLNPGHAIEAAWFIFDEACFQSDSRLVQLGCNILDYSLKRGWDEQFGGLFYFRDLYHRPVQEYWHDMKFWWPHNEAVIATLYAYLLTGKREYAVWHDKLHRWSFEHFEDKQHGEWFGYLHRDGSLSNTLKGGLW
ncbi:MAG: AGE family epimerase/isomerase, partial [Pirellulales bacterium]